MTHVVHQLYETDCSRWDDYVNRADSSTFFHLSGWAKVLKRAFGHTTYFLFSEKAGRIEGVLPLAQWGWFPVGAHDSARGWFASSATSRAELRGTV